MEHESLWEEVERLKKENAYLRKPEGVVGMSRPSEVKTTIIAHQNDPTTGEVITSTIREDMGIDRRQIFQGRRP